MWRATTYFPPIFIGIVTYLIWRHGLAKAPTRMFSALRGLRVPVGSHHRPFGE
jgi:hypothetical protein